MRSIPFVQQLHQSDCGAACLAMLLAGLGRSVPVERVRRVIGSGTGGVSALDLMTAGERFGLRGRGIRIEHPRDLRQLPRGAILHWRFNHFLVLDRASRKALSVVDPALGRRRISSEKAAREFTGVALLFEPDESFECQDERTPRWRALIHAVRRNRAELLRLVAVSLLVQLPALCAPLLIALVVDQVLPQRDLDLLTIVVLVMGTLVAFNLLASVLRAKLLLHLRTVLEARLTVEFVHHLLRLPLSFFDQRRHGDLMMRINSNLMLRDFVASKLVAALLDGLLVVSYLVLLLFVSVELLLLVVLLGFGRVAVFLAARRRFRERVAEVIHTQALSQGYQMQLLQGIETLKASGTEAVAFQQWSGLFHGSVSASRAKGDIQSLADSLLDVLGLLSPLAVLALGSVLVLDGSLSLGAMLAGSALATGFLMPLSKLVHGAFDLQNLAGFLERVYEVMEMPVERPAEGSAVVSLGRLRGEIELDRVSFRYADDGALAVRELSLEIPAGSFVAVVGSSGAGKSTLARLLLGLYPPSHGRVLVDGIDLREVDLTSLRRQIGIVPQNPFLFSASIRANIGFNAPDLPLASIRRAADDACIRQEIESLPMSYETPISDGGAPLSGGQRQRVALARALAARPRMLLLDEATSALDSLTESRIFERLAGLRITRVVIAHRLSTVRDADLILVMDRGSLVEMGRHAELLAGGGHYRELVSGQVERGERRP